ncbi:unnamed protein product [Paramecium sonneborni]|uniref:Uncharacterized protein n=1 Tax=Paramecium sonneborni TaxID=65129 RepID=A0A8S1QNB7_9CILI|nr:unnamed protein product [Paramecium sonneborni]CAD8117273.1 unnamed protein product [Paramecium sonneborni]
MNDSKGPKIMSSHSFNSIKNEELKKAEVIDEQSLQTTQKRGQPKINISRLPPAFANKKPQKKQIEPLAQKKEQKQQVQQNLQNIEAIQEYKQVSQMLSPLKALIINQTLARTQLAIQKSIGTFSLVHERPKKNT